MSATHPAAVAWQALGQDTKVPIAVETVMGKDPTRQCVYRLAHATAAGDPVIAKRYRVSVHGLERMFYQDVLPFLPVSTPRYYGEVDAGDGYVWIFLEDAGREHFAPDDPVHRALAARWLGAMHLAAPELPQRDRLPDRGPSHYRARNDAGRRLILDNLGNPAMQPDDVVLLRSVVAVCESVERRWHEVEEICARGPTTLVHGDFRPKNVFIRDGAGGPPRLLPIDWETAGWAPPAADLAPSRRHYAAQVDLDEYCRIVRQRWPGFDALLARRLMWVGLVFRRLAAIEWAAVSLMFPQPRALSKPLAQLRVYGEDLRRALDDASGEASA